MTITSLSRILSGHDLSMTQKLTSFVGMLDNYSTLTTVAFSLRKLRTTYSGSAVRVRRSFDNTELDIGFNSAGDLDQTSLTDFVGLENLVAQSQTAQAWSFLGTSVSAINTETAPDGTLTADTVQITLNSAAHTIYRGIVFSGVIGQTYVFSAYVKAGTTNLIQISTGGADFANAYANFDVSSGISTQSAGCTPQIVSVGSGWYRISMSATCASSTMYMALAFINSPTAGRNPSYLGNGTDNVIIWGMQLNRDTLKTYAVTVANGNEADGFVTVWYDQMDANNAFQITAANQPRLVEGGVVKTYNAKPGIEWHTTGQTDTRLITSSAINNTVQVHTVSLLRTGYSVNSRLITNVLVSPTATWGTAYSSGAINGGAQFPINGTSVLPLDTVRLIDFFGSPIRLANIGNVENYPRSWYGGISEVVIFTTATTADERLQLDAQIMSYYGII